MRQPTQEQISASEKIGRHEYEILSRYIEKHSGIVIAPEKSYLLETRLTGVMAGASVRTFGELCRRIQSGDDPGLRKKIIDSITTNETTWFRDRLPWELLEKKILPRFIELLRRGEKKRIRIWFSAVSTGQEAYSTVMCIDDYLKAHRIRDISLSDFEFIATDISGSVLDIARHGKYDSISIMRGLDSYYKDRYFTHRDAAWELNDDIRKAVSFSEFNLIDGYAGPGTFDVIFCRYVMIYFSETTNREIARKMHGALSDGGIFITGNYFFYDLLTQHFGAEHYGNMTYYYKRERVK